MTEIKYGKVYVQYELPGFDYASFIGGGYLSPASILKIGEQGRSFSYGIIRDLYTKSEKKKRTFFIAWQQVEMTPQFLEVLQQARSGSSLQAQQTKLKIVHTLDAVGSSSQGFKTVVTDKLSNVPLMYVVGTTVAIDLETRRPAAFSDLSKRYFSEGRDDGFVSFNRTLPNMCVKKIEIPTGVEIFKYATSVSAHDVDSNQHSNQAAYGRFCFNCLADAVSSKFCPDLSPYVWDHPIRRISVLYLKEAAMGDCLEVLMWRNEKNDLVFHFHVVKKDAVVCQAELELFRSETQPLAKL